MVITKEHYGFYGIADISPEHVWIQSNPSGKCCSWSWNSQYI